MMMKVYFDENSRALGTSEDYYGEYFASEFMLLPDDIPIEGKPYHQLKRLSENMEKAFMDFRY